MQTITEEVTPSKIIPEIKPVKERLISLDAFRGLTILLMLLVNNISMGASTPPQLQHAKWNQGIHIADLVFPWFLLCMGLAIPFSAASFAKQKLPPSGYHIKVIMRGLFLLLIGNILNWSEYGKIEFGLGVLQDIGLAYVAAALLYKLPSLARLIIAALLLACYGAAISYLPYPGGSPGLFLEKNNILNYWNSAYLGRMYLAGLHHVIPMTALALFGAAASDCLRKQNLSLLKKILKVAIFGSTLLSIGIYWNNTIPYSKVEWTPSYILFTAGSGLLMLCVFSLSLDVLKLKQAAYVLIVFGSNAIVAYVAPILTKVLLFRHIQVLAVNGRSAAVHDAALLYLQKLYGGANGGALYTGLYILIWWLVLAVLYHKKWFVRV